MKFLCQLTQQGNQWIAEHTSPNAGPVRVTAPTRAEALCKLGEEIRYWLEMSPCCAERYRDMPIELVEG